MIYLFALISIAFSAFAQYFLKVGVGKLHFESGTSLCQKIVILATDWPLLCGIGCYVSSMFIWLYVLSKMEMSKAYPLVGLGYVFTLVIGYYLLDESINTPKVIGVFLILLGVIFITRA